MKRILCALLVLVLIVMGVTACGEQPHPPETDLQTEAPETEASLPDGYKKYDNGSVSFAYPSDWIEQDGSTVILVNASGVGNNITVVYEAKNDFYKTMDASDFEAQVQPVFEQMGMVISNVSVEQTENQSGLAITKISFLNTVSGAQMQQTLFVVAAGDRTYTITVTETTPDAPLIETVFNSLKVH